MQEAYLAGVDAYVHGSVKTGKAKAKGQLKLPWYMEDPDKPKPKGLSGQPLHDAVDAMMARLTRGPN